MAKGLDVGTSFLITGEMVGEEVVYKEFRDAFYRMKPASPIAAKMMAKGLANSPYYKDEDGSYVVLGSDAIAKAIERHESASRPLSRGVISPTEPAARQVLKYMLTELVGKPSAPGEKLVYSVPGEPVDQGEDQFNTEYHEDVLRQDLGELGWDARALNEAEAICYSELEADDYTGICLSFGAGMVNVCVMSSGEPVLQFSTVRSGDWIDRMASVSTAQPDSVIQVEKENGDFTVGQPHDNPILSAVSSYYVRLVDYTIQHLIRGLTVSGALPKFSTALPIILSGGTSRAQGFLECFKSKLEEEKFPIEISKIRHASDPLRAVARGCMLAASL